MTDSIPPKKGSFDLTDRKHIVCARDEGFVSLVGSFKNNVHKLVVHIDPHPGRVWFESVGLNAFILHGVGGLTDPKWKSVEFQCDGISEGVVNFKVEPINSRYGKFEPASLVQFYSSVCQAKTITLLVCHFILPGQRFLSGDDSRCAVCLQTIVGPEYALPCCHMTCHVCYMKWGKDIDTVCRTCIGETKWVYTHTVSS